MEAKSHTISGLPGEASNASRSHTCPYWSSWAPVACRRVLTYCWGMGSREVPVSTMAWQPWEHQPEALPSMRNLNGEMSSFGTPSSGQLGMGFPLPLLSASNPFSAG